MNHLIGLMGRSRVGKDTVAEMLKELLKPAPFETVHIARPLKDSLAAIYGFNHAQLYGDPKDVVDPRYQRTPREMCASLSHFLMDKHGKDFLVRRTFERYDMHRTQHGAHPFWIIPDVRYMHDYVAIKRRGGLVWKITREDMPLHLACENHIDLLPCDAFIRNDADLKALRHVLRALIEMERTKRTCT